jgi:hypothetical protein
MKETVLVTEPEFRKGEAVFRSAQDMQCEAAPPEEDALAETVAVRGAVSSFGPAFRLMRRSKAMSAIWQASRPRYGGKLAARAMIRPATTNALPVASSRRRRRLAR